MVPVGLTTELLVVDNASVDGTAGVIQGTRCQQIPVRYLFEPKPGQSNARNAGMANTSGEVILFTDDDVRVPVNWIEKMSRPILNGSVEAVAGAIMLAPELERPWMTGCHRGWLAVANATWVPKVRTMTGANMAFSRGVLQRVPAFDPELGPGALGFSDDTLFSLQIIEAGFRLKFSPDCEVEHHPERDRLMRHQWLATARRRGATKAYVSHHWLHEKPRRPQLNRLLANLKLRVWRGQNLQPALDAEGCAERELRLVRSCSFWNAILLESLRPRHYAKRGLVKLRGVQPVFAAAAQTCAGTGVAAG